MWSVGMGDALLSTFSSKLDSWKAWGMPWPKTLRHMSSDARSTPRRPRDRH